MLLKLHINNNTDNKAEGSELNMSMYKIRKTKGQRQLKAHKGSKHIFSEFGAPVQQHTRTTTTIRMNATTANCRKQHETTKQHNVVRDIE